MKRLSLKKYKSAFALVSLIFLASAWIVYWRAIIDKFVEQSHIALFQLRLVARVGGLVEPGWFDLPTNQKKTVELKGQQMTPKC